MLAPTPATWNREAVFADWNEFLAELDELEKLAPKLRGFEGRLTDSAATLLAWLQLSGETANRLGRALTYATMASSVDSSDASAKAMYGKAMGSLSAIDTFAIAEIDMTSKGPMESMFRRLEGLVAQLEAMW